ncbi:uracil-DNA glycosylase family protein [Aquimarina sp. 2201CG5-10]|uniref:uracil-DNA glycosylase family protein n=1 Tax=Aquimarina callyspongiae TaxID=3098150 RepID=UPI002AB4253C|nr:uracil-DNA glycosylase family protein [Aquimarina sp. 2201CG5-10]MDY8135890.1 uracil-DNA glycosylase family protein [Aquimarina sp. 2201CG5-10]
MEKLLQEISKCTVCSEYLELGPRPIVSGHIDSKVIIIGQAPGTVVHRTGVPWDDKSGENLRNWMGIDNTIFYDATKIGLVPMGFCYPGKGKTGDLPPRKECAPLWHTQLLQKMKNVKLTILVGKYAQDYYLGNQSKRTLTETVRNFEDYLPNYFVLPHPSPRNNIWQAKNEWFGKEVLPRLKQEIVNLGLNQ